MSFELTYYPCGVCGSKQYELLYIIKNFNLVQCNNCRFVYVNPRIKNNELYKIYSEHYFSNQSEGYGYRNYELTSHLRIKTFQKWMKNIDPYLPPSKGLVLDIGCAAGHFLDLMRNRGWEVEAIELDKQMAEKVRAKNILVSEQPFEEFISNKKYNLITMFDVIEHIPDLKTTFKKLHDLLDDNGVIALITPNFGSTQRKLFGKRWFQFKPYEHIQYFTPQTLAKVIEPYGLKLIHTSASGQYADTGFLLDRLDRYNFKFMKMAATFATTALGLKNKYWYMDTGSLFAVLKKQIPSKKIDV